MEKAENDVKARVIEEQDILIYFWYNYFNELLFYQNINFGNNIRYKNIDKDIIANNLDIVQNISINNLGYLLTSNKDSIKDIVLEEIMKRFRNGEHIFSGENAESEAFGNRYYAYDRIFSGLGKENIEELKSAIKSNLDDLKQTDPRAYELAYKIGTYTGVDNFLYYYEKGCFTNEKLDLLERMYNKNNNIFKTINFGIFEDEIFDMGEEFVSRSAKFPNFSAKLIKLLKNNPKLFEVIKEGFLDLEQNQNIQVALDIEYKMLGYVTRQAFYMEDDLDFKTIANCALRRGENDTNIQIDYKSNYNEEFNKECDKAYSKANNLFHDRILSKKKEILFSKYFGMTATNAQEFFNRYIKNIAQIEIANPDLMNYINGIERALKIEDIAELDKIYYSMEKQFTPLDKTFFEYEIREGYTQTFSKALKDTNRKIQDLENIEYIEFEGKKIKQVKIDGEFNLLVHSTDSGFKENKNLKESDETLTAPKDPSSHLASSCFINQDFLGHVLASGNGVTAVFSNVEADELSLMGPTDINTHIRNYNNQSSNGMYMSANRLPYNSRRVYNEVPIERRKQDYLLIFDDTPEEIKNNTYRLAIESDSTVIFIDKKEIEKQQLQNLDLLMNKFKETGNLQILEQLIETYETNVAGWLLNRDTSEPDESCTSLINNERFREDFEQKENNIYELINDYILQNKGKTDFQENITTILRNYAKRN